MTRIDFYVLDDPNKRQHQHLVCRLTEKAWREGRTIHIICDADATATELDDLLWTYKDISFLPHAKQGTAEAVDVPVTLGCHNQIPTTTDVLINLGADVPDFFSRFERVMETTGSDPKSRSAARERYRYYQERGYALNTHKLEPQHGG
jgi:DNA polymerase-3 subunit chi